MTKHPTVQIALADTLQTIIDLPNGSPRQQHHFNALLRYSETLIPRRYPEVCNATLLAICGGDRHPQVGCTATNLERFLAKFLGENETLQTCDRLQLRGRYFAWVRRIYTYKEMDYHRQQKKSRKTLSLDQPRSRDTAPLLNTIADDALTPLEALLKGHEKLLVADLLNYLRQDPVGQLQQCHPRRYAHCHAQAIIGDRLLAETPLTWQEISAKYGIAYGTVTTFYSRRVVKLIKAIAQAQCPDLAA